MYNMFVVCSVGNLMISIVNPLMKHLVVSPTCWAIDNDIIMIKCSRGNMVITSDELHDSSLPTPNRGAKTCRNVFADSILTPLYKQKPIRF